MERILYKDNLNGITVDEIGAHLRENQKDLIERICRGKYSTDPIRRKETPKPDGVVRKLGLPTDKDSIF